MRIYLDSLKILFIYDCPPMRGFPDLEHVTIEASGSEMVAMRYTTILKSVTYPIVFQELQAFTNGRPIQHFETIKAFINLLGFIPLFTPNGNKGKYCGLEYKSFAEFTSQYKCVEYTRFLDINIPTAYVNQMLAVSEMCNDLGHKPEELTLDDFPKYLEDHIHPALEALKCNNPKTVESLHVYDHLDILDLVCGPNMIIYGDQLLEYNQYNALKCGTLLHRVDVLKGATEEAHLIPFDESFLTDNIIEVLEPYKSLMKMNCPSKQVCELYVRSMKLLIQQVETGGISELPDIPDISEDSG